MKKAILIHGWADKTEWDNMNVPTPSNCHWLPWLTKNLMIAGVHTVALEMPTSYYPEYELWKKELERFEVDEGTILVGHSCGGGFIVRWLSENSEVKIHKVILVAPWVGINPKADFDETFFQFTFDRSLVARTNETVMISSTDDKPGVKQSEEEILSKIDAIRQVTLENKGHFTFRSLGGEEFPELLQEILR